jgi:Zn ribbon nucleic-acid-binding protein
MIKLYECPRCKELHTLTEWNNQTLKRLTNRVEKRKFIPFESSIVTHRNKCTHYECPSCMELVSRVLTKESLINDDEITV